MSEQWVAGYVIDFTDGESQGRVLHEGTLEDCENMRRLLPAVSYSGARPVKGAHSFVMRKADWETIE